MADFLADHQIVTEFALSTCRERQWLNVDVLQTVCYCAALATVRESSYGNEKIDIIPVTTGSVAEFYIQPMFSCIGDRDIMYHRSDELAIPAGTAPPTQLPDEFHRYVEAVSYTHLTLPTKRIV